MDRLLSGLDLNLLVVLDAVLAEPSVKAAARRIGLSQSATSHALGRLRRLLDDPILLRTAQGMTPTVRGRALAEPVRRILAQCESVFANSEVFDPGTSREVFRLSLDPSSQLNILPHLVENLRVRAPEVSLDVSTSPAEVLGRHLALGLVDFAISAELPTQTRAIRSQKLLSAQFVSVLRADHPSARGRLTLNKFLALRHVIVDHPGLADTAIDAALSAMGKQRRIAITLANPGPIPTLLAHSDFIATLPRTMLEVGPSPADLKTFPPPIELDPVTIYLISHERTAASPAHQWMSEAIVQTFRQLPLPSRR